MEVPERFTAVVELSEPAALVELQVRVATDGQPRITELTVKAMPDGWVTTGVLRGILPDQLLAAVMPLVSKIAQPAENAASKGVNHASIAARVYVAAVSEWSKAPTEAVALQMNVSRSQASRYIRAARELGQLNPSGHSRLDLVRVES